MADMDAKFDVSPKESGERGASGPLKNASSPLPDDDLVRLRNLLFSREMALLETLDDPRHNARRVGDALAEALRLRAGKDPRVSAALEPLIDDIVKNLLRKRRNEFVESLFPLIGPSIRKSIAETFRTMLESFSNAVETAFSWQGLRWRFEAMRSGRPFSEIALLHTLIYRVEQVFFIHSETGIALAHVVREDGEAQDAGMVSAMLTAIQDFVRDCFTRDAEGELEALRMGDCTILIEKSPRAYVACVIRGTPPPAFREQLRTTLEFLLVEYNDALPDFRGDTAPFASAEAILGVCLSSRYANEGKKLPLWAKALPVVALLSLAGAGGYYISQRNEFLAGMENALHILQAEPGLVITNVERRGNAPWSAVVLKDALAPSPEETLRRQGVDPALFSFTAIPFISCDAAIIAKRAKESILLLEGVNMTFDGKDTLRFWGSAPSAWILKTRDEARALPGIKHVDISGLRDPMADKIAAMAQSVEGTVIRFARGKETPIPEDELKLKQAVDTLAALEKALQNTGFSATLTIYGYADAVGSERRNYDISQARARSVAAMLYAKGSFIPVSMFGMGAETSKDDDKDAARDDQSSRRVELRVHIARAAGTAEMFLFVQP